jgi:hypothetical protein
VSGNTATRYRVTITFVGSGSIQTMAILQCNATSCFGDFDAGTNVTLSAVPDPGWQFAGWGGDCAPAGQSDALIVVTQNTNCTATFTQIGGGADGGASDGGGEAMDGGSTEDGGLADGGATSDGGASADGGTSTDGGTEHDGGPAEDGGTAADGGEAQDGGAEDGGVADGGANDGGSGVVDGGAGDGGVEDAGTAVDAGVDAGPPFALTLHFAPDLLTVSFNADAGVVTAGGSEGWVCQSPDYKPARSQPITAGQIGNGSGITFFSDGTAVDLTGRFYQVPLPAGGIFKRATSDPIHGFVVVGEVEVDGGVQGIIYHSTNLTDWTQDTDPAPANALNGVTHGSGFVAVGAGGTVLTSSDGVSWESQTSGTTNNLNGVDKVGSNYLVTGNNNTLLSAAADPDGGLPTLPWTEHDAGLGAASALYSAAYNGTNYVAVGSVSGDSPGAAILSSPDLTAWTREGQGVSPSALYAVLYTGSQFVAVGQGHAILTSVDGTSWTAVDPGTGSNGALAGVAASPSAEVAVGGGGRVLTSSGPDAGWSRQYVTSASPPYDLNGVVYAMLDGGSTFVAVGANHRILSSADGTTWNPHLFTPSTGGFFGVASGGSGPILVAVGDSQGNTSDGGTMSRIFTSPDGTNWTQQSAPTTHALYGVAAGSSGFVAVGENDTILTSPDGVSWTSRSTGVDAGSVSRLNGVAFGGSTYVAVGGSGLILTSPDGVTWTQQTSGTTELLAAVAHVQSQFVAVGSNGTVLTSPDGMAWSTHYSATKQQLNGVGASGSSILIVGQNELILVRP